MKKTYTRYSLQSHLLIINKCVNVPTVFKGLHNRGKVKKFSKSSAWRMRRYLRNCTADYSNMLTLTYPCGYPEDGRVFKDHLRRLIQELRRQVKFSRDSNHGVSDDSFSVFWFMEFQSRGAAHFHLFLTHRYSKEWIAKTWYRIVGSEDERHLHAGTRIEKIRSGRRGTVSYASKYAAKSDQKVIPKWVKNAGRFWGISGLREAVVADILVDTSQEPSKRMKLKVQNLNNLIQSGLDSKRIGYNKIGTARILYIKDDSLVAKIATALFLMEVQGELTGNLQHVAYPHHEIEDMSCL